MEGTPLSKKARRRCRPFKRKITRRCFIRLKLPNPSLLRLGNRGLMPTRQTDRGRHKLPWWQGWGLVALLPTTVGLLAAGRPRWVLMWSLAIAIYAGCKWLTWRRTSAPEASWWKHAGYLVAWP